MNFNKRLLLSQLSPMSEIANYETIYRHFGVFDKITTSYNTDGWCKGCIIEHKLNLGSKTDELSRAKKELIRYNDILSKNGEYKAYYLIALDQLNGNCYVYAHNDIENAIDMFNAYDEYNKLLLYINAEKVVKYDVNILNVVALSEKYYNENPKAKIKDFFNYIRTPNDKVNEWKGKEQDFAFIIDELTDPASQKILGRFYTPEKYTSISRQYVLNAIDDIKDKYSDYIILDRCAGSGNLEIVFDDDEIITHFVLNTIEWKEYIALMQRFSKYQNKPRAILPPAGIEYSDANKAPQEIQDLMKEYIIKSNEYQNGLLGGTLIGGDALSENFINSIQDYIELHNQGKLGIIILENPPYADTGDTSNISNKKGKTNSWVKEQGKIKGINGNSLNELSNQFIWSAFKYYSPDHAIIYSPIKYWKSNHILEINGKEPTFVEGYLCNRKFFHATESAISLIHWKNVLTKSNEKIILDSDIGKVEIYKVYSPISSLYPKEKKASSVNIGLNTYCFKWSYMVNPLRSFFTDDITKNDVLQRGVEITKDNILEIMPLFSANNHSILTDYTKKEVLMCSGDGGKEYLKDKDFLNDCLFYSLLTQKNKTSVKSDFYSYGFSILEKKSKHQKILKLWQEIYDFTKTYGIYNIIQDDENYIITIENNKKIKQWRNPQLGDDIKRIRTNIELFYIEHIKEKMFKFKLIV